MRKYISLPFVVILYISTQYIYAVEQNVTPQVGKRTVLLEDNGKRKALGEISSQKNLSKKQLIMPTGPSLLHKVIVYKKNKSSLDKIQTLSHSSITYDNYVVFSLNEEKFKRLTQFKEKLLYTIIDAYNYIYLPGFIIDGTRPLPTVINETKLTTDNNLYLLQFAGPIKEEWRKNLKENTLIAQQLRGNAFIIWADKKAINLIKQSKLSKYVQLLIPYHNRFRAEPKLIKEKEETILVTFTFFNHQQVEKSIQAVMNSSVKIINEPWSEKNKRLVRTAVSPEKLKNLSALPDLLRMSRYYPKSRGGERQDLISANQLSGTVPINPATAITVPTNYLEWFNLKFPSASSQFDTFLVDIADGGIDRADTTGVSLINDLKITGSGASRLSYVQRIAGMAIDTNPAVNHDTDGHGTHIATITAGFNDTANASNQDTQGHQYGIGISPYTLLGSTKIFEIAGGVDTSLFPNMTTLYSNIYSNMARISSNSWGDNTSPNANYSSDSVSIDALVRDAVPATPGNQQLTMVFLAGNDGFNFTGSSFVDSSLWNDGSTAKNTIVVGGSENTTPTELTGCSSDPVDADSNNVTDLWFETSSGPTIDGRFKPDLVAPATRTFGGRSLDPAYPTDALVRLCADAIIYPAGTNYRRDTGTSYSVPAVAGAAALLRQWFINLKSDEPELYTNLETDQMNPAANPTPAMTKAWLINTTEYLTSTTNQAGDTLPSNHQGMGRLDVNRALDDTPRVIRDQVGSLDFTAALQERTIDGVIADDTRPFRVTLAWTDPPGVTDIGGLINDLDLEVSITDDSGAPVTTIYRGNVFTNDNSTGNATAGTNVCPGAMMRDHDCLNNVESVWIPESVFPNSSNYTYSVKITAFSLNGDGIPGVGGVTDQDFALVIYNGNLSPVNMGITVPENSTTPLTTTELSVNNPGAANSDIVFTISVLPVNGEVRLSGVSLVADGTFTLQNVIDGLVTYFHNGSETLSDSFMFTVTDGYGATSGATETFSISVTPVNDSPVAVDDLGLVTDEDMALNNINVVANDTDPEGNGTIDASTVAIVTMPTNGIATVNGDGTINYVPNPDTNGVDSFTYTVNDNSGDVATQTSNAATVSITVNAINDSPVAIDDLGLVTNEDTALNNINVLANDTDPEGNGTINATTVTLVMMPSNGIATVNPDGTINYVPNLNTNGPDSFTYTVNDNSGDAATETSNAATVSITVNAINDSPIAVNDPGLNTDEDVALNNINVLANDTDPEGNGTIDASTVAIVTMPTNGIATVNGDGTINYVPTPDTNGADSFTYTVNDNSGDAVTQTSNAATVSIMVNPVNDLPVATGPTTCTAPGVPLMFTITGSDIESASIDVLSIQSITTSPVATNSGGQITHAGLPGTGPFSITYDPVALSSGMSDSFEFIVNETGDGTTTPSLPAIVTINIDSACRQPVDVVLVLDTSGSMNGIVPGSGESKIDLLSKSIDMFFATWATNLSSAGTDRIGLVYFNSMTDTFTSMLLDMNNINSDSLLTDICGGTTDTTACTRTGGGSTAMGAGLQEAYALLTGGLATNSSNSLKNIILFTDGMQNRNPMVNDEASPGITYVVADIASRGPLPSGYAPIGVNTGVNPDFAEQNIKIHSIGLGTPGATDFYTILEQLSDLTTGSIGNARFTDDATGMLPNMWEQTLVDLLSTGSLAMVGHDKGTIVNRISSKSTKHSYPINSSAISATFVLSWQGDDRVDALQFALRHKKTGTLIPSGTVGLKTIKKKFYTVKHIDLPLVLPDGNKLTADSEWEMLINGKLISDSVDYQTWSIIDDTGINYRFEIPKTHFNVGDTIKLSSVFTDKKGNPVLKKLSNASVLITAPSVGVGTFLSTNSLKSPSVRSATSSSANSTVNQLNQLISATKVDPDRFLNNADKKLYLLLQNPELRTKFTPKTETKSLTIINNKANIDISDTKVPGIYNFQVTATGIAADGSTVQRTRTFSKLITIKSVLDGKTNFSIDRKKLDKANLQVRITPIDKYGNYLGPGLSDKIVFNAKGIEKIGPLVDSLDGSYTQNFVSQSFFGDTIKLKVLDAELVVETGIDPRVYWLIIFILLLLVLFAIYKLLKK